MVETGGGSVPSLANSQAIAPDPTCAHGFAMRRRRISTTMASVSGEVRLATVLGARERPTAHPSSAGS